MVKQVFGKEPHKGVNPDEVVAIGAAIQAGVLMGEVKDILLLDVTPLTLGVETYGGVMTTMIPRNTTIPTSKTETYTTAADAQTSVEVHVLQGERPMATENKSLGRFILDGILPAPRGVPQVEVTFDIDANGILNVSAKDKATGKEQKIVIQSSSGLSDAEIKKMVKDAEEHAADDARRREEIEVKNHADSAHYQAEKMLREQGDKMPEPLRIQVAEKSSAVKRALDASDVDTMKTALEELQQAMMAVGQAVYGGGSHLRRPDRARQQWPGWARVAAGHRRGRIPRGLNEWSVVSVPDTKTRPTSPPPASPDRDHPRKRRGALGTRRARGGAQNVGPRSQRA